MWSHKDKWLAGTPTVNADLCDTNSKPSANTWDFIVIHLIVNLRHY